MSDFHIKNGTLVSYTGTDTTVQIPAGVKAIGERCFMELPVERVILPEGLKSIGNAAFMNCKQLTAVKLPKSVDYLGKCVFQNCTALQEVQLSAVAHISYKSFCHCRSLKSIILPKGVVSIGVQAFWACLSLEWISFPATLRSIDDRAFDSCRIEELTLPEGFKRLGEAVFYGCSKLRRVTIPDSTEDLGAETFDMCWNLDPEQIKVPAREKGTSIFTDCGFVPAGYCQRCAAKMTVNGPNYECPRCKAWFNIKYFTEPHGRFAEAAAAGNTGFLNISGEMLTGATVEGKVFTVPDCVTKLGERCLTGKPYETVIISTGVTEIGYRALAECRNLKTIVFPPGLETVCGEAFAGTPWLQERQAENPLVIVSGIVVDGSKCSGKVVIPDGVKAVAEMAFRGNTAITSVYVPDSVKQMGSEIFAGCENLQSVSVPAEVSGQLSGDMVEVRKRTGEE